MREEPVHDNDDEDNPDIFGTDATLQVTVDPTWHQNRRGGSDIGNTLSDHRKTGPRRVGWLAYKTFRV